MPGYIEDRWFKKGPADPATGKPTREETALHGKGMRYKVAGIPGVRSRSFPDKQLTRAKNWLADAQSKSLAGEFVDPRRGQMLLADYIEKEWLPSKGGNPTTLENIGTRVRTSIIPHLGAYPLNTIKVPQLRQWLKDVDAEIGPGTLIVAWGYLSAILQAAVEDERIARNYCKSKTVGPPKGPEGKARAWQRDRVLAVRESLTARYRILVDLGVGAGLRQGEALGLSVDDIDFDANLIRVRRQIKKVGNRLVFALPKGDKTRVVPLSALLATRIRSHLEEFPAAKVALPWGTAAKPTTEREAKDRAPQTHELIVTTPGGFGVRRDGWNRGQWKEALIDAGVIPPATVREVVNRAGRKRKVKDYPDSRVHGFHVLRHTFASVMLDAREPIVAVSKWLGHADPSITLRVYAHMMPEADGRGRAAIDAWFASDS